MPPDISGPRSSSNLFLRGAQQNAALREMIRLSHDLKVRLASLDKDTLWELMSEHPQFYDGDFATMADTVSRLEDLEQAADAALQIGERTSGPRAPSPLRRIVPQLAELYLKATGKKAHSQSKAEDQVCGKSPVSRWPFHSEVFEIVDENVSETSLSTAIADLLRSGRSSRKNPWVGFRSL